MISETYNEGVDSSRDMRRLAGAVLTQAITDLRGGIPQRQRDASQWIFQGDSGVISFNTCCDYLQRDPGRVRKKIVEAFGLPRNIVETFTPGTPHDALSY